MTCMDRIAVFFTSARAILVFRFASIEVFAKAAEAEGRWRNSNDVKPIPIALESGCGRIASLALTGGAIFLCSVAHELLLRKHSK
jgi:hypothetical protein